MRSVACRLAVPIWLGSAGVALAQTPPAATLVEGLLGLQGRAYVEARETLLDRPDLVDAARAVLETTTYEPSTWLPLILTEALAMHVTNPQEAEHLYNLRGLDSDHYLLRRQPVPSASRELRQLEHVAPLMFELFLKGMETYPWSSPALAEAEAEALRRDLLVAIGRSDHPASVYFLTDVIEGNCACCASCDTAVAALGDTGAVQGLPILLVMLNEARAKGDTARHAAAIEALGRIRNARVWPHIAAELGNPDSRIRIAAIRSAAAYGSRWHWTADPVQGARIRATIGSSVLDVLAESDDEGVIVAALESLGSVATPELRGVLEQQLTAVPRDDGSASRVRQALERVNRSLARRQGSSDGPG